MIRVSDHALLRFLERVGGFDVEAVRAELEHSFERAQAAADQIGAQAYSIRVDGYVYIVRSAVVTTVQSEDLPCDRFAALRPRRR